MLKSELRHIFKYNELITKITEYGNIKKNIPTIKSLLKGSDSSHCLFSSTLYLLLMKEYKVKTLHLYPTINTVTAL